MIWLLSFGVPLCQPLGTSKPINGGVHWYCTTTTVLRFSGFCLGLPGWAGTRINIYPLTPILVINHPLSASPFTAIYGIFLVQFMCLTVFSHNFCPSLLWSTLWSGTLSTSYSIHFFTQSLSSFCSTCPYDCTLFCCSTEIISSNSSLSALYLELSFTLMPLIHLTILISARWSATSFSFLTGQVSLPCNILLCTQLLYNLPLTISDISLLVCNGTNCLNLFCSIYLTDVI